MNAVAEHRVADRPNRIEPRRLKRKYKRFQTLDVPRREAKRQMLKGLTEKEADLDHNGEIYISELQSYLATKVPELTDNLQQPTMRVENISNDWRVW